MKRVTKKITTKLTSKANKPETELEALARLVRNGFERMDARFEEVGVRFEQVDARFEKIDSRFEEVDSKFEKVASRFDLIDTQFATLRYELNDHTRRLDRIERNQSTMLTNLDETVHRSEFSALLKRVDVLEKKSTKK